MSDLSQLNISEDPRERTKAMETLYKGVFSKIRSFVLRNNGTKNDAEDIFHDGLVTLYHNLSTGTFEQLPFDAESFDLVWSQDALLHSNKRERVFWEVARVLNRKGRFLFTDPMQSDDCPKGGLKQVLDRIHLEELGSKTAYLRMASRADLECVFVREMPQHLVTHYSKILSALTSRYDEMIKKSDKTFIDNMITGVNHWIEAGKKGYLNWGILQFQKRNY